MTDINLFRKLYPKSADRLIKKLEAVPETVRPVVTLSDKEDGFITRYFVRNATDMNMITEVDKKQYSEFKDNSRYITIELRWKIIGKKETIKQSNGIELFGTIDTNKITVTNADLTFGGLRTYITNYSEFWVGEL
jgi:hypothetical protein